ncbi:HesB/IscA family protein [Panacibacter ginsenosidivorans]|uniref:HesB/IscA family protein n=1 Tax=Panacibacter ginsenosidivorans TaxID=1813871 RepID=UPI0021CEDDD9|nr:iron-sulfur cluster assembly accessory protein [Panacibacter ginsenosidivorans]
MEPEKKLRVGVKGGGCSGMSYVLGFDEKQDGDKEFDYEGVPCVINKAYEIYLYGMQINREDGLNNRGFTFNNLNASTTCLRFFIWCLIVLFTKYESRFL